MNRNFLGALLALTSPLFAADAAPGDAADAAPSIKHHSTVEGCPAGSSDVAVP
jgi:hypothetical protein